MDLRQASYVVAVVDEGSFTAAAASIPVSQPALSQAVASLERELGAPLFHRIGRRVQLTPAGEAFVDPARRMLRDAAIARSAVSDVAGLTGGRLDIVAIPTLVVEPLVDLVGRFRQAHPGVQVRIVEPEDADAVLDRVRDGTCELGMGDTPVADRHLVTDHLGDQRLLAVLPPGSTVPSDRDLPVSMLAAFPLITGPRGTSTRRLIDQALAQSDTPVDLQLGVVTEHREAIVPLVLAGAGAAVLPEPIARVAATMGAVIAPLSPAIERPVVLVRRTGTLSAAAVAFRELAVDQQPPTSPPTLRSTKPRAVADRQR